MMTMVIMMIMMMVMIMIMMHSGSEKGFADFLTEALLCQEAVQARHKKALDIFCGSGLFSQ